MTFRDLVGSFRRAGLPPRAALKEACAEVLAPYESAEEARAAARMLASAGGLQVTPRGYVVGPKDILEALEAARSFRSGVAVTAPLLPASAGAIHAAVAREFHRVLEDIGHPFGIYLQQGWAHARRNGRGRSFALRDAWRRLKADLAQRKEPPRSIGDVMREAWRRFGTPVEEPSGEEKDAASEKLKIVRILKCTVQRRGRGGFGLTGEVLFALAEFKLGPHTVYAIGYAPESAFGTPVLIPKGAPVGWSFPAVKGMVIYYYADKLDVAKKDYEYLRQGGDFYQLKRRREKTKTISPSGPADVLRWAEKRKEKKTKIENLDEAVRRWVEEHYAGPRTALEEFEETGEVRFTPEGWEVSAVTIARAYKLLRNKATPEEFQEVEKMLRSALRSGRSEELREAEEKARSYLLGQGFGIDRSSDVIAKARRAIERELRTARLREAEGKLGRWKVQDPKKELKGLVEAYREANRGKKEPWRDVLQVKGKAFRVPIKAFQLLRSAPPGPVEILADPDGFRIRWASGGWRFPREEGMDGAFPEMVPEFADLLAGRKPSVGVKLPPKLKKKVLYVPAEGGGKVPVEVQVSDVFPHFAVGPLLGGGSGILHLPSPVELKGPVELVPNASKITSWYYSLPVPDCLGRKALPVYAAFLDTHFGDLFSHRVTEARPLREIVERKYGKKAWKAFITFARHVDRGDFKSAKGDVVGLWRELEEIYREAHEKAGVDPSVWEKPRKGRAKKAGGTKKAVEPAAVPARKRRFSYRLEPPPVPVLREGGMQPISLRLPQPVYQLKKIRVYPVGRAVGPEDIATILRPLMDPLQEEVWLVVITSRGVIPHRIHKGAIDFSLFDLRVLFRVLLVHFPTATMFAVAHNHPSGNSRPSLEDRAVTARIRELARAFGYQFVDHVIVTSDGGYWSMAMEGQLVGG